MEERKILLEKIFARLDELSDNYKGKTEPMAFLEQLRTWVKENADNELMKDNEKFISKFRRKAEDFSDGLSDSVIGDVFLDIYEYDWTGEEEEEDEDVDEDED